MTEAKGTHGGARKGAGRPRKRANVGAEKIEASPLVATPLEILEQIARDPEVPVSERIKAAQAAAPYRHAKLGESGKKEDQADAAKKAASQSRFAAAEPPRLVVSNKR